MAFSADELRVLRRALAEVLHPSRTAATGFTPPRPAEYVQDYLRLVEAVDDAVYEAGRMRVFLLDELSRYRQALPGTAAGYLERLTTALAGGYVPGADDLAALRRLRALPSGTPEHRRRTTLLRRCETLAENDVRLRLEAHMPTPRRLLSLPGPTSAPDRDPEQTPDEKPPATPAPQGPPPQEDPGRRTPTPAEIWPPHRRARKPEQEDHETGYETRYEAAREIGREIGREFGHAVEQEARSA